MVGYLKPVEESTMPDGEYGLVAPAPAGSVSPSALADNESVSRIERNKSTILSAGDARFAGRDTLLQGPIAPRLIGLAFPILIVLAVQTLVSVAETYFVGFLGDDALAGVALVFPILMLMTMMSNGGIGGGVASAIARAIGAGRMRDAEALMGHSVVIAVAFGAVFTAAILGAGEALFGALGGRGEVLANALRYSSLVFGAAVPIWIVNLLAAALRGAGNVRIPAILTAVGAAMTLCLSPLLIFGWGPFPRFGVAGAGLAMIVYYLIATAALIAYLRSPHTPIRLVRTRIRMVGTNVGAGQMRRARHIARIAALISAGATGLIGLAAALAPAGWIRLFSDSPEVIRVGVDYLHRAAPFYACYGFGMALYFASQGAGSVLWPFIAGCVRLAVVTIGGWYWITVLHGSLEGLLWIIAASLVLFGVVNVVAFATGLSWRTLPSLASRKEPA